MAGCPWCWGRASRTYGLPASSRRWQTAGMWRWRRVRQSPKPGGTRNHRWTMERRFFEKRQTGRSFRKKGVLDRRPWHLGDRIGRASPGRPRSPGETAGQGGAGRKVFSPAGEFGLSGPSGGSTSLSRTLISRRYLPFWGQAKTPRAIACAKPAFLRPPRSLAAPESSAAYRRLAYLVPRASCASAIVGFCRAAMIVRITLMGTARAKSSVALVNTPGEHWARPILRAR